LRFTTLGRFKYFWGTEVAHSRKGTFISQQKYIIDLLKEIGKTTCKLTSSPFDPNIKLGSSKKDIIMNKEMYQTCWQTYLLISHYARYCFYCESNKSIYAPTKEVHLQSALKIVQYVKGISERGIYLDEIRV